MQVRRLALVLAIGLSTAFGAWPSDAGAADRPEAIEAGVKGKLGFGLLGAEIGAAVPAIIGLDELWPYLVFPGAGAVAGAILGQVLIDSGNHAELSVLVLTASLTLVIPTLVLVAAGTAYDPEDDAMQQASLGTGAVRLDRGELRLAAPALSLVPDARAGTLHVRGVSVSLVSGRF